MEATPVYIRISERERKRDRERERLRWVKKNGTFGMSAKRVKSARNAFV